METTGSKKQQNETASQKGDSGGVASVVREKSTTRASPTTISTETHTRTDGHHQPTSTIRTATETMKEAISNSSAKQNTSQRTNQQPTVINEPGNDRVTVDKDIPKQPLVPTTVVGVKAEAVPYKTEGVTCATVSASIAKAATKTETSSTAEATLRLGSQPSAINQSNLKTNIQAASNPSQQSTSATGKPIVRPHISADATKGGDAVALGAKKPAATQHTAKQEQQPRRMSSTSAAASPKPVSTTATTSAAPAASAAAVVASTSGADPVDALQRARAPLTDLYGSFIIETDTCLQDARQRLKTALGQCLQLRKAFTERVYGKYRVCLRHPTPLEKVVAAIEEDPVSRYEKVKQEIAAIRDEKEIEKREANHLNAELASRTSADPQDRPAILAGVDSAEQLMYWTAGLNLVILPEEENIPESELEGYTDRGPVHPVTGQRIKSISQAAATAGEVMLDRTRKASAMRVDRQRRKQLQLLSGADDTMTDTDGNLAYSRLSMLSSAVNGPHRSDHTASDGGILMGNTSNMTSSAGRAFPAAADGGSSGATTMSSSLKMSASGASQTSTATGASSNTAHGSGKSGRSRMQSSVTAHALLSLSPQADELGTRSDAAGGMGGSNGQKPCAATMALIARGVGAPQSSKTGHQRLKHPHPESMGGRRRATANLSSKREQQEALSDDNLKDALPPLPTPKERLQCSRLPVATARDASTETAKKAVRGVLQTFVERESTDDDNADGGRKLSNITKIQLLHGLHKLHREAGEKENPGTANETPSSGLIDPSSVGLNPFVVFSVLQAVGLVGPQTIANSSSRWTRLPAESEVLAKSGFRSEKLENLRREIERGDRTLTHSTLQESQQGEGRKRDRMPADDENDDATTSKKARASRLDVDRKESIDRQQAVPHVDIATSSRSGCTAPEGPNNIGVGREDHDVVGLAQTTTEIPYVPDERIRGGGEGGVEKDDKPAAREERVDAGKTSHDATIVSGSSTAPTQGVAPDTSSERHVVNSLSLTGRGQVPSNRTMEQQQLTQGTGQVNPNTAHLAFLANTHLGQSSAPSGLNNQMPVYQSSQDRYAHSSALNALHLANQLRHMHHPGAGDLAEYLGGLQQRGFDMLLSGAPAMTAAHAALAPASFSRNHSGFVGYTIQDRAAAARAMFVREHQHQAALLGNPANHGYPQPQQGAFHVGAHSAAAVSTLLNTQPPPAILSHGSLPMGHMPAHVPPPVPAQPKAQPKAQPQLPKQRVEQEASRQITGAATRPLEGEKPKQAIGMDRNVEKAACVSSPAVSDTPKEPLMNSSAKQPSVNGKVKATPANGTSKEPPIRITTMTSTQKEDPTVPAKKAQQELDTAPSNKKSPSREAVRPNPSLTSENKTQSRPPAPIKTQFGSTAAAPAVEMPKQPSRDDGRMKIFFPLPPASITAQQARLIQSGRFSEVAYRIDASCFAAALDYLQSVGSAVPIPKALVVAPLKDRLNTPGFKNTGNNSTPPVPREIVVSSILVWLWANCEHNFQDAFGKSGRIDVDPDCKWLIQAAVDTSVKALSLEIADSVARGEGPFAEGSAVRKMFKAGAVLAETDPAVLSRKIELRTAFVVSSSLMTTIGVNGSMNTALTKFQPLVEYLDEARLGALRVKSQERVLLAALLSRKVTITESFANAYVSATVRAGEALGHNRLFETVQNEDVGASTMIPYDIFTDESGCWEDPCKTTNGFTSGLTGDELIKRAHARATIQKSLRKLQERHTISGGTLSSGPYADPAEQQALSQGTNSEACSKQSGGTSGRTSLKRRLNAISEPPVTPGTGSADLKSWTVYDPKHLSEPLQWEPDHLENTPYGRHRMGERSRTLTLSTSSRSGEPRSTKKARKSSSANAPSSGTVEKANPDGKMSQSTREIDWSEVARVFQSVDLPKKSASRSSTTSHHEPVPTRPGTTIVAPFCRRVQEGVEVDCEESDEEENLDEEGVLANHQVVLDEMKARMAAFMEARKKYQERRRNKK